MIPVSFSFSCLVHLRMPSIGLVPAKRAGCRTRWHSTSAGIRVASG